MRVAHSRFNQITPNTFRTKLVIWIGRCFYCYYYAMLYFCFERVAVIFFSCLSSLHFTCSIRFSNCFVKQIYMFIYGFFFRCLHYFCPIYPTLFTSCTCCMLLSINNFHILCVCLNNDDVCNLYIRVYVLTAMRTGKISISF